MPNNVQPIFDALLHALAALDDQSAAGFDEDSSLAVTEAIAATLLEADRDVRAALVARAAELATTEVHPERKAFFANLDEELGLLDEDPLDAGA